MFSGVEDSVARPFVQVDGRGRGARSSSQAHAIIVLFVVVVVVVIVCQVQRAHREHERDTAARLRLRGVRRSTDGVTSARAAQGGHARQAARRLAHPGRVGPQQGPQQQRRVLAARQEALECRGGRRLRALARVARRTPHRHRLRALVRGRRGRRALRAARSARDLPRADEQSRRPTEDKKTHHQQQQEQSSTTRSDEWRR